LGLASVAVVAVHSGEDVVAEIKGGAKFEAAMYEIASKLADGQSLQVGFLEGATYPDGKSVAFVAAMNEFGHGTSPPRPFFRNMVRDKSPEWPKGIATQLKATNYDVNLTLNRVGEAIRGQLVQSINDLTEPPLAPSTIKRKGFDKPLIDKGIMVNSPAYRVNGK
jgi:hypothetical protein